MEMSYAGPLWHVAMVEAGKDIKIAEEIHDELGFPVFVPAERVWTMRRGLRIKAAKPMFSGYVFPRVDARTEDWGRLRHVRGVLAILGAPVTGCGLPGHVPAAWVEAMRHAQEVGSFDRTKVEPDGFSVGDLVTITEGPFAKLQAEIRDFIVKVSPRGVKASKRAKLLMQFLGRVSSIEVDVTALEKV